jgi:hypothetical protein
MATSTRRSSVMQKVRKQVDALAPGQLLTYADLGLGSDQFTAVAAALSRLCRQGVLQRFSRGTYFRPKETRFGNLQPSQAHVVETLTTKGGRPAGYASGPSVYNQLGFTTQVPGEIVIATPRPRRPLPQRVRFVLGQAPKRAGDVPLLQLLDVLRDVRRISDTTPDQVVARLRPQLAQLDERARRRLTWLARKAAPRARALLGALLELQGDRPNAERLHKTLNQVTSYQLGISALALPNRQSWHIR